MKSGRKRPKDEQLGLRDASKVDPIHKDEASAIATPYHIKQGIEYGNEE